MTREHLINCLNNKKIDMQYFYKEFLENCEDRFKGIGIKEFADNLQKFMMYRKPYLKLHEGLMKHFNVGILTNLKTGKLIGYY